MSVPEDGLAWIFRVINSIFFTKSAKVKIPKYITEGSSNIAPNSFLKQEIIIVASLK